MLFAEELEKLLYLDNFAQLDEWMTTDKENERVSNRDIVLLAGIWCGGKENIEKQINQWLCLNNFKKINFRDMSDSFFLYVYNAFRIEGKKTFGECLSSYKKYKDEYDKYLQQRIEGNRNLDISTFGDLHNRISVNSTESEHGTMLTRTIKPETEKVEALLKNDISLSDYLDELQSDENIKCYQEHATLILQRMLYNMLKRTIDNFYNHNLLEGTEDQFITAKEFALSSQARTFDRYLKHNRLFLEDIKIYNNSKNNLREWLKNNENSSEKDCLNWLQDKKIGYGSLYESLLKFYSGKSTAEAKGFSDADKFAEDLGFDNVDRYEAFWGKKSVDLRGGMTNLLKARISGKIAVSREFLILFGFYAGYEKEALNIELQKCNFAYLNEDTPLEKFLMEEMQSGYVEKLRESVNKKRFIEITRPICTGNRVLGQEERHAYEDLISDFSKRFVSALNNTDSTILKEFFGEKIIFETVSERRIKELSNTKLFQ